MPLPPLLLFVNIDNTAPPLIWGYTLTQHVSQPASQAGGVDTWGRLATLTYLRESVWDIPRPTYLPGSIFAHPYRMRIVTCVAYVHFTKRLRLRTVSVYNSMASRASILHPISCDALASPAVICEYR